MAAKRQKLVEKSIQKNQEWKLEIPKISLTANISQGTDENVMNEYIGHFCETEKINGNVAIKISTGEPGGHN